MKKNKKNTPETEAGNVVDNQVDKNIPEVENEAEPEEAPEVDIEQLQAENQKLREDYLRAFAEAENTKRRCAQEIEKTTNTPFPLLAKICSALPTTSTAPLKPSPKTITRKTAKPCSKASNSPKQS